MPGWIIVLLDIAIIYFFFGNYLIRLCRTARQKEVASLKALKQTLKMALRRDGDLMTKHQKEELKQAIERISSALSGTSEEVASCLKEMTDAKHGCLVPEFRRHGWLIDNFEMIVVALGVAFGIRSLLLQPFKIPTGSMQPTLYGIVFEPRETLPKNPLVRLFNYCNFSERGIDVVAREDATVDMKAGFCKDVKSIPFFPKSQFIVKYGDKRSEPVTVAGASVNVGKAFQQVYEEEFNDLLKGGTTPHLSLVRDSYSAYPRLNIKAGDSILKGVIISGDHLFVNRLSLCFHEPSRGDVMVFNTKGLSYKGKSLGGSFYIKRLIGLPGDTLKIVDSHVWVKPKGETEFHVLDEKDHPAFKKIYSGEGGYEGHSVIPVAEYLNADGAEYTVPENEYFMLGDNTNNSLDSRFWGSVPRSNLIGTPGFVWWPFSKRFALVDRN